MQADRATIEPTRPAVRAVVLDGEWRLRCTTRDQTEVPATVPGGVHAALVDAGRIGDPFVRDNVNAVAWVEEQAWTFARSAEGLGARTQSERDLLVFTSLDGLATVAVDGVELVEHRSSFRPLEIEVSGRVDDAFGIEVAFAPIRTAWEGRTIDRQWGHYAANERAFVRKPQAQFSWDHCPRLVDAAVGPVRLERRRSGRLVQPWVRTVLAEADRALVIVCADVERWDPDAALAVTAVLTTPDGRPLARGRSLDAAAKSTTFTFDVEDPALWWPNGLGEQALHGLSITLSERGEPIDEWHHEVGVRTVRLARDPLPDEPGTESFTFVVNGAPVFAKGANWVPPDLLATRSGASDRAELLGMLAATGANMVRVWGGGSYEPPDFHEACDRLGLLVWQDFMFAGARYPDEHLDFSSEVVAEASFQVARLRNHASTALWCGNNEIEWWEDVFHPRQPGHAFPGSSIERTVLPGVVHALDPDTPWWPSSPYGGDDHNSEVAGDRHHWTAWHGLWMRRRFTERVAPQRSPDATSFRHLGDDRGRFLSEFGIQAYPSLDTLARYLPDTDLRLGAPQLLARNKNLVTDRLDVFLDAHAPPRTALAGLVDWSQFVQAEGLKLAIETARRRKFSCSGALVWQWNDAWPAVSWSIVDVDRRPKAAWWALRRAFAPVLACAVEDAGGVGIWLVNDTLAPIDDVVSWRVVGFDGGLHHAAKNAVTVPANTAILVDHLAERHLSPERRNQAFVVVDSEMTRVPNRTLLGEPRELARAKPDVVTRWRNDARGLTATVASDTHALAVRFAHPDPQVSFSDNWFDLAPGEHRELHVRHRGGAPLAAEAIEVAWW